MEEEYFLLDPDTRRPVPLVDAVRAAVRPAPVAGRHEVQQELLQAQIEVATPVCRLLAEGGPEQRQLRAFARDGVKGVVKLITDQTVAVED